jgi:hypothetical protein
MIFSHWRGKVSVRTEQYRLDNSGRLYDLTGDPGQRRNIASDHREVAARLSAAVARWKKELLPGLTDDDRPFTVGYREFPRTHLPARDGVPHGNIRRSARAPNCSFFTNWTSAEDRITWDVEVATSGMYEAVIYYTCAEKNIGSTIELSLNGSRVQRRVTVAHNPPLRGKEDDRTPRGSESYVKDFKPFRLGAISLKKGRGQLSLRAIKIPGSQVMDVRYVRLTLQD